MSVQHPVVGSWRVSVEIPGAGPGRVNLATLSPDGAILVAFPSPTPAAAGASHRLEFWTPAIGSWSASGEQGAVLAFVALGSDENGAPIGTHTVSATVAADANGQGWHGPFTITVAGPDGTTLAAVSGTVIATPIAAAANPAP